MEVWAFEFPADYKQGNLAKVSFLARPHGGTIGDAGIFRVEATSRRSADGQWQLQDFKVYNAVADQNEPMSVPYLGPASR